MGTVSGCQPDLVLADSDLSNQRVRLASGAPHASVPQGWAKFADSVGTMIDRHREKRTRRLGAAEFIAEPWKMSDGPETPAYILESCATDAEWQQVRPSHSLE